ACASHAGNAWRATAGWKRITRCWKRSARCAGGRAARRVLRSWARTRRPGWGRFPAPWTPPPPPPCSAHLQAAPPRPLLRELAALREVLTADRPLLLVLEDLQWADHATVDGLAALARRRAPAHLVLVATYRPVDLAFWAHPLQTLTQDLQVHQLCHELAVEPLSAADIAAYLAAVAAVAPLPEGLAALLYRHSQGNPLFMPS